MLKETMPHHRRDHSSSSSSSSSPSASSFNNNVPSRANIRNSSMNNVKEIPKGPPPPPPPVQRPHSFDSGGSTKTPKTPPPPPSRAIRTNSFNNEFPPPPPKFSKSTTSFHADQKKSSDFEITRSRSNSSGGKAQRVRRNSYHPPPPPRSIGSSFSSASPKTHHSLKNSIIPIQYNHHNNSSHSHSNNFSYSGNFDADASSSSIHNLNSSDASGLKRESNNDSSNSSVPVPPPPPPRPPRSPGRLHYSMNNLDDSIHSEDSPPKSHRTKNNISTSFERKSSLPSRLPSQERVHSEFQHPSHHPHHKPFSSSFNSVDSHSNNSNNNHSYERNSSFHSQQSQKSQQHRMKKLHETRVYAEHEFERNVAQIHHNMARQSLSDREGEFGDGSNDGSVDSENAQRYSDAAAAIERNPIQNFNQELFHHDSNTGANNNGGHNHNDPIDGGSSQGDAREREANGEESSQKNQFARLIDSLLCIFPKVEPLPWGTFFILSVWCAIPPAGYIAFFTQMGLGENLFYALSEKFGDYAYGLAIALAAYIFTLYMLDANDWKSTGGAVFLDISILTIITGLVLLVLLIADKYPYGMVCLFALFNPLWLLAIKIVFYGGIDTRVYVSWLSGPLFFMSVAAALAWTIWVFYDVDNQWNTVARMEAAERTGCEPNYDLNPDCRMEDGSDETCFYLAESEGKQVLVFPEGCSQTCTSVYNECLNGFILWIGPVLVSMTMFFLSFFCTFFRTEGAKEKDILNFGKVWIFILVAMWVTASMAGSAAGLTAALAALTLASFVASAVFISVSFSKEERDQNAAALVERIRSKYGKNLDVVRGLFVVTCAPIILVYFGLSIMNQFVRATAIIQCSQPAREDYDSREGRDIFTIRTRKQINVFRTWNRAKVYTIAIYWGIAFMVLQVIVAKLTVVFLSWLIEKTSTFGLGLVTVIMMAVGVLMFLLPPVPGVPVYLTLGIVLPAQGHETLGWAGSIAYAVAVGLVLKLFSSALQQKMIGEKLSNYVKVRQFIGINSTLMRAMRLELRQDGLSVPKVAILIGGPDWPTSVLCGIMRLKLTQIMIGTTPIVFLITPTTLTGALLYMASLKNESGNPEFPWAGTVSAITASLTAIVQFGSMVVAAYYLEQTADKRAKEVESIPIDIGVKDADDRAEHFNKCYRDVTEWNGMPVLAKMLLRTSLASIVIGSYIEQIFASQCFVPHSLTDTIDDNLAGSATNLFLPLGWVVIGLFFASCLFLYFFQAWGKKQANILAMSSASVSVTDLSARRRSNNSAQRPSSDSNVRRSSSNGEHRLASDDGAHLSLPPLISHSSQTSSKTRPKATQLSQNSFS